MRSCGVYLVTPSIKFDIPIWLALKNTKRYDKTKYWYLIVLNLTENGSLVATDKGSCLETAEPTLLDL